MKYCNKCEETKPLSDYWKNKCAKDGLQAWCKPCWYKLVKSKLEGDDREKYLRMRRNGHYMKKYGITLEEYEAMASTQGNVCFICKKKATAKRSLAVDHCHKKGNIRGILCENCNRGLGMFNEDPEIMQGAIEYLRRWY